MKDSAGKERPPGQGAGQGRPVQPSSPARTPTQGPEFFPAGEDFPPHPATEAAQPLPADAPGWERTGTVTGGPGAGGASGQGQAGSPDSATVTAPGPGSAELRYGPGVPGPAPSGSADAGQSRSTAEEVWRTGRSPGRPPQPPGRPPRRWQRRAGTGLTALLLIACGIVVYLRLHHAPLAVTGVAITSQAKSGCTDDVTGRISTSGGAGTVSYQWVFTPQSAAPQPLRQSVTAGQSAVYVTVSVQGTGQGQAAQQVTLEVLGPGQGSASTHVIISC